MVSFQSFATFKVSSVFIYTFIVPPSQEITTVRAEKKRFVEEPFVPSAKYQICSWDGLVPWPIATHRQLILTDTCYDHGLDLFFWKAQYRETTEVFTTNTLYLLVCKLSI